jgi:hypothetical protein
VSAKRARTSLTTAAAQTGSTKPVGGPTRGSLASGASAGGRTRGSGLSGGSARVGSLEVACRPDHRPRNLINPVTMKLARMGVPIPGFDAGEQYMVTLRLSKQGVW